MPKAAENCFGCWTHRTLLVEAKLMSFTAGFKLAAGIAGELGTPYSFDADEEEKAKEMITNG